MNDASRAAAPDAAALADGVPAHVRAEIAARFDEDRPRIAAEVLGGSDPGPLRAIEATAADRHQSGRAVVLVWCAAADEPVVYKPRPLQSAELYAWLSAWLGARLPELAPAAVPTLVREGYGWSRHVRPAPCRTAAQARRFHRRQGALLALLHAANATDVHAENLIAHGDQPLLIDTETLLHPVTRRTMLVGDDPAAAAQDSSVLRTLLLPTLLHSGHAVSDISGLSGGLPGSPNRPVLDGRPLDPALYLDDLLWGFRKAYDGIRREADSFGAELGRAATFVTRFVPRPTQEYVDVLMGGSGELEAWFDGAERLAAAERRDLAEGDVPVFFTRPDSRAVWTSRGERIDDVLERSGLESAIAKVRGMSADDRRRQEWMIRAACATRAGAVRHRGRAVGVAAPSGPPDPQRCLDQAIAIARCVGRLAHRSGRRVNWLGLEPLEDGHWTVLPTGLGLSHGYTGVALFLAQLGALADRPEFLELAADALAPAPGLVAALAERPGHLAAIGGGFSGMGGVAFGLRRLSVLLDSPDLRGAAHLADDLVARVPAEAPPAAAPVADDDSWCRGLAGQAARGRLAGAELADWLARLAVSPPLPDATVCHGEFGILEALTLLAEGSEQARATLEQRVARLPDLVADRAVFRGAPGSVPTPGFMHGLAGVGYGLLRVAFPRTVPSALTAGHVP